MGPVTTIQPKSPYLIAEILILNSVDDLKETSKQAFKQVRKHARKEDDQSSTIILEYPWTVGSKLMLGDTLC